MHNSKGKSVELCSNSKSEFPDDLTFIRDMIENPQVSSESIDYQFLQKELNKRRPQPVKQKKGIELIEPQTKPSIRKIKYIKSPFSVAQPKNAIYNRPKSNIREITYTFSDVINKPESATTIVEDNKPGTTNSEKKKNSQMTYLGNQENSQLITDTITASTNRNGPKQPKSYLSWKFIGDTKDGNFGILTGKIDARETPTTLKRNFANIPYVLDNYHIEFQEEEQDPKPKIHPRDLFALSVIKDRPKDIRNARTISRLQQQKKQHPIYNYQYEPDTKLFLETDEKLIPLVVSSLPKGNQV